MRGRLLGVMISMELAITGVMSAQAPDDTSQAIYVTQPGDTLRDLSLFFEVLPGDLIGANGDTALNVLSGNNIFVLGASSAITADTLNVPTTYIVQRGDTLFRIATRFNIPPDALADANDIPWMDRIYVGQILTIPSPNYQIRSLDDRVADSTIPLPKEDIPQPTVLDGKQIVVDLSQQQTYVFENGQLLRHFLSSTGLPNTPTVTGDFAIYVKYDTQRMAGPGYDLPGVPWVMYFYQGYALHGAYWHNNFGNPMSHGCVNLRIPEAEWLYLWAPVGTSVHVVP